MSNLVSITTNTGETVYISELKKDYINNIIYEASLCKYIDSVILFGSSLEEICTEDSDVDYVIITKKSVTALTGIKEYEKFKTNTWLFNIKQDYDCLDYRSIETIKKSKSDVCKEIEAKGKVIYTRSTQNRRGQQTTPHLF